MKTTSFFLRVSLCALLIVESCGMYLKGSKSQQQSSGGGSAGGNFASYPGPPPHYPAPVLYSPPRLVSAPVFVQDSNSPQPGGHTTAVVSSLGSAAPAEGDYVGSGSVMPLQTGAVSPGYVVSGPAVPLQTGAVSPGYVVSGPAVPLQAGAVGSGPVGSVLPETQWAVPPQSLAEAADDAQTMDASDLVPSPFLPPPGPSYQSGEASSVVKEAELGNFQRQTEEFGYPADQQGPEQGFTNVVVPQFGVGGSWGYPGYDYRFILGLLPPGTYTTFSQHHEKGKDYSQAIHYLTEHSSDDHGSGQQKKVFQAAY